jgi:hypothetical protein
MNQQLVVISNVKNGLPVYSAFKGREKVEESIFSRELDREELEHYRTTPEAFKAETPKFEEETVSEPA